MSPTRRASVALDINEAAGERCVIAGVGQRLARACKRNLGAADSTGGGGDAHARGQFRLLAGGDGLLGRRDSIDRVIDCGFGYELRFAQLLFAGQIAALEAELMLHSFQFRLGETVRGFCLLMFRAGLRERQFGVPNAALCLFRVDTKHQRTLGDGGAITKTRRDLGDRTCRAGADFKAPPGPDFAIGGRCGID